jgi:tetratricopeptide (TPR) repeat protein
VIRAALMIVAMAIAVAVISGAAGIAAATPGGTSYAAANHAYQEGRYHEAIDHYEGLVQVGILHEDLFYNLGNAYFRSGQLGPAIYSYERALRLAPGMSDAAYNLDIARETVADRVIDRLKGAEADPLWVRTVTMASIGNLTIIVLALNAVFFAILVALRFLATGFTRTALIVTNGFVAAALAGAIVLFVGQAYFLERFELGIVLADQVHMREGPDDSLAERGQLHPGLRVRVLGREPGWSRIRLSNGVEGWVPDSTIGEL